MSATALRTFGRGGFHTDTHKELTRTRAIERVTLPREVCLPLSQHIGEPATPIVAKGDEVIRGQMIAEGGATGCPIHATISGKVRPLDKRPHPTLVTAPAIVIAGSGTDTEPVYTEDLGWRTLPRETALERIREAGIVGLGGAAFPTYRKLMLPPDARVDTLVINGAECEPYLTSDFRIMLEHPAEIVEGALAMARLVGVKRVLLGVEEDKSKAVAGLEAAARATPEAGISFAVTRCQVRYPQGAEKQLVEALTGRVIPPRALPYTVGVVVQNVATAAAVHDALRWQRPLLDRVVTVTGPGIIEPKNLIAPIGTMLSHLIAACGGMRDETTRVISGGPMMGRALPRLDLPLLKGMNGLVLLTGRGPFEDGYGPCIGCARCVEACPLGLEPDQVSIRIEAGKQLETGPYGALECYECGACTFVCPAGRPLLQFMQMAKSAVRRASDLSIVR